jgi:GNAT superfamily N-acetyltransferase
MASMTIREMDAERDADEIVALLREAWPTAVMNRASWLHRIETLPERAQDLGFVAVDGGRVVGNSYSLLNFFTAGSTSALAGLTVRESHRRHGLGGALYDAMVEHCRAIGATGMHTTFYENEAGVSFARSRGFVEARREAESMLDPRTVKQEPPPELELRPVRDVDPHLVYEADIEATRDVPATEQFDYMPYDEWEGHVLRHPLFTLDGSFAAIVDGVAAAISFLVVDPESGRAANMFTGTLAAYRGRGFAPAVKLATIRWAAANGVTSIVTTNDETNAAMLAVNRRLGYLPANTRVEYVRAEMPSSPAPPAPAT